MKKIPTYFLIIITILAISIISIPFPVIYKPNYIEFYDVNNKLISTEIENKPTKYIHLKELSQDTINAFIAFEDKNFYKHNGFDTPRIIKSLFKNIFTFSFSQGASTISQQYARTLFLNNKKTLTRKIKETYYTLKLERNYSKEQILEGYLNTIYLGHGCYGIESASLYYFNKSSSELTLAESATLASLPSSPVNSSPLLNYNKSKERRKLVLKAMLEENYISINQYQYAINEDITLNKTQSQKSNIQYYIDQVKSEIKKLNMSKLKGLKIYTNVDLNIYNIIEPLIKKYQTSDNQLSLIILENFSNQIIFNIGGFDYKSSSYNRSIHSKRQVGSTIKTFLYTMALENNFSLDTKLKSEQTTFFIKDYGDYAPSNANDIYANERITMKEAYAVSDNIYAVKTLLLLGSDNFINYLKKFNLFAKESVPSIALGSCEFTLLELLKAYSIYSNDGYLYNYSFINEIRDNYNNILYSSSNSRAQILSKKIINQIKILMTTPFKNSNYYTKSTLENYDIKGFYGKSGSTTTDSYLILFNEKYTIGAWLGNDNNNKIYDYTTTKFLLKDITNKLKMSTI